MQMFQIRILENQSFPFRTVLNVPNNCADRMGRLITRRLQLAVEHENICINKQIIKHPTMMIMMKIVNILIMSVWANYTFANIYTMTPNAQMTIIRLDFVSEMQHNIKTHTKFPFKKKKELSIFSNIIDGDECVE